MIKILPTQSMSKEKDISFRKSFRSYHYTLSAVTVWSAKEWCNVVGEEGHHAKVGIGILPENWPKRPDAWLMKRRSALWCFSLGQPTQICWCSYFNPWYCGINTVISHSRTTRWPWLSLALWMLPIINNLKIGGTSFSPCLVINLKRLWLRWRASFSDHELLACICRALQW